MERPPFLLVVGVVSLALAASVEMSRDVSKRDRLMEENARLRRELQAEDERTARHEAAMADLKTAPVSTKAKVLQHLSRSRVSCSHGGKCELSKTPQKASQHQQSPTQRRLLGSFSPTPPPTPPPVTASDLYATDLESNVYTGASKCVSWWNTANGPNTLGLEEATVYWSERDLDIELSNHAGIAADGTYKHWTSFRRAGCRSQGDGGHVYKICGCYEIWCERGTNGEPTSSVGGPCYTLNSRFGCRYGTRSETYLAACYNPNVGPYTAQIGF